jgi:hypothetical protein
MTLREKQSLHARKVALLILYAFEKGYEITMGDAYRDPRCPYGSEVSLHAKRLAQDLNLFLDGEYLTATDEYQCLGDFWESIGGRWGGTWEDGNHFETP